VLHSKKEERPMPNTVLAACVISGAMAVAGLAAAQSAEAALVLQRDESFFVGGAQIPAEYTGGDAKGLTPAGTASVGYMYVHGRVPAAPLRHTLILAHGARHTGVSYETTPDGREGWATYFVRKNHPTYVLDAPGAGRSGFYAGPLNAAKAQKNSDSLPWLGVTTAEASWVSLRVGPKLGEAFPGTQFPVEAAFTYFAQSVPNVNPLLPAFAWRDGMTALIDRVGASVLITHSASGAIGWQAAVQRPNLVKAIVSLEPNCAGMDENIQALKGIPNLVVFGDYMEAADWKPRMETCRAFVAKVQSAGGRAEFLMLADKGVTGNSHMLMLDRNNIAMADLVLAWLTRNVSGN